MWGKTGIKAFIVIRVLFNKKHSFRHNLKSFFGYFFGYIYTITGQIKILVQLSLSAGIIRIL